MLQQEQERNRYLCGRCYNNEYDGYLCVNEIGDIISPDYVSKAFKQLLRRNNLKEIRFHDLRHSCASMLLANGVPMKQIQEWLVIVITQQLPITMRILISVQNYCLQMRCFRVLVLKKQEVQYVELEKVERTAGENSTKRVFFQGFLKKINPSKT